MKQFASLARRRVGPLVIASFNSRWLTLASRPAAAASLRNENGVQRSKIRGGNSGVTLVRLSKRMSELDLCSRREADRLIMEGRVIVGGRPVDPVLGQKVPWGESDISILTSEGGHKDDPNTQQRKPLLLDDANFEWPQWQTAAVVLHKPMGYVSGQPETAGIREGFRKHVPAVRLLSRARAYLSPETYEQDILSAITATHTKGSKHRKKKQPKQAFIANDSVSPQQEMEEATHIVKEKLQFRSFFQGQDDDYHRHSTLQGFVPAGRLDLDSSGLLIFSQNGVMSKKLIAASGKIEKEYVVQLQPVNNVSKYEREAGLQKLPRPTRNLSQLRQGGQWLWNDPRPLKPVAHAGWILDPLNDLVCNDLLVSRRHRRKIKYPDDNQQEIPNNDAQMDDKNAMMDDPSSFQFLRLVLTEGRKHQVRRMCRELLGYHVVNLVRTRVGPVSLGSLPMGQWRPLRQEEARTILSS